MATTRVDVDVLRDTANDFKSNSNSVTTCITSVMKQVEKMAEESGIERLEAIKEEGASLVSKELAEFEDNCLGIAKALADTADHTEALSKGRR